MESSRWLHDKYERLAAEESELITSRTTYYAAIGTVLITGLLVSVANLLSHPFLIALVVSFLAALGVIISIVWIILLRRTVDAQTLWREAAYQLEEVAPPVAGELHASVRIGDHSSHRIDLLRPYHSHKARFSPERSVSWSDRLDPATLTAILPLTFLAIWTGTFVVVWVWYLTPWFS